MHDHECDTCTFPPLIVSVEKFMLTTSSWMFPLFTPARAADEVNSSLLRASAKLMPPLTTPWCKDALNPSTGIDQDLIRHVVVVIWGCRIAPTGRLNVKGWMYWVFKVNMNSQYLHGSSYLAGYDKISFRNNGWRKGAAGNTIGIPIKISLNHI